MGRRRGCIKRHASGARERLEAPAIVSQSKQEVQDSQGDFSEGLQIYSIMAGDCAVVGFVELRCCG